MRKTCQNDAHSFALYYKGEIVKFENQLEKSRIIKKVLSEVKRL